MKVTLGRTIQPKSFESLRLELELSDTDFPTLTPELSPAAKLARLQYEAYKNILQWQAFHGSIAEEDILPELQRFKESLMKSGKSE